MFLIESIDNDEFRRLELALNNLKYSYNIYNKYSDKYESNKIFYGSINGNLANSKDNYTASFSRYRYYDYYKNGGLFKYMLNSDCIMVNYESLYKNPWIPNRTFGEYFVRTNKGSLHLQKQVDNGPFYPEIDYEDYIFSSAKSIGTEYRVFCSQDKVITGSTYGLDQNYLAPQSVLDFCQRVIDITDADFMFDPVFTIDICEYNYYYKIVEFNSFHCAGFYSCNIEEILKAVYKVYETKN